MHTSLFHDWKQQNSESVDKFAQDSRKLYNKAYPPSMRGGEEAEAMGNTVLASQFVAGLKPDIRKKIAGCEHTSLDQLLIKARFEEAKQRELTGDEPKERLRDGSKQGQLQSIPKTNQMSGNRLSIQQVEGGMVGQIGPPFTPSRNSRAQSSATIVVGFDIWHENANGAITVVMKKQRYSRIKQAKKFAQ